MYVIALALGAICAAFAAWFTVQLYRATNKYNDLVQAEATVRIEEARQGAEEARKQAADALRDAGVANAAAGEANNSAAQANERAEKLESGNLTLRGQVAMLEAQAGEAKRDVAVLQKATIDAKATQQRVETELAKQQERAAIAEKSLDELRERMRFRHFTEAQERALALRGLTGELRMKGVVSDPEAANFAQEVANALRKAGLQIDGIEARLTPLVGFLIQVRDLQNPPPLARELKEALQSIGFDVREEASPTVMGDLVYLVVGSKPHD